MNTLRCLTTLTLALLVSACGTYSPLKPQDKSTVNGVAPGQVIVNKNFELASWFDGAVAAAQGSKVESLEPGQVERDDIQYTDKNDQAKLAAALARSGLDLKGHLQQTLIKNLIARQRLQATEGQAATHTLAISVDAFALGYKPLSGYGPDFGLQATLLNQAGRPVWKNYKYVTHFNGNLPHYSLDEYIKRPELLKQSYETAAVMAINELLDSLVAELNNKDTEIVDNITGERIAIEPVKPTPSPEIQIKPTAVKPAAAQPAATESKSAGADTPKPETKPVARPVKKMVRNPVTDEMEEETNCNGWCGLSDGFKFDQKNPHFD